MRKIFKWPTLLLLCAGFRQPACAQEMPDKYLQEAFAQNLVLKNKNISLQKSLIALKEARSLFLPTAWFEGQYTLAQGGRSIDIPVGDLLNPVYRTLNQLTGSNSFPFIKNVSEQFLPDNFYDVRVRTTLPLIQPDLRYNRQIKETQVALAENETERYKRELVKEVKTAYFNYLAAGQAISIYQNALQVVNQNLRVNQSLLANGKGLPAYVARAESEVKQVENQLLTAGNDRLNAKAYFNFLLNKLLTDSIEAPSTAWQSLPLYLPENNDDISRREELKSLQLAKNINGLVLKMNQSFRVPRLNAFLDLAAQGFDFKVNNKSWFYLGGLQLKIPLFTGKRNLMAISQTQLEARDLAITLEQTQQQLQLAATISRNNIYSTYSRYQASVKQQQSAQQYFKLIDRGYKEGVNSFIEFLDARTQLTNSQLQTNIAYLNVWLALTDYERQTASYSMTSSK